MDKSTLGKAGEEIAEKFLSSKGYKIIGRNYRMNFGEIDIIAKTCDGILVFVEVKTSLGEGNCGHMPEDNLTRDKLSKFKKIANFYAARNSELIDEELGWRIDAVTVVLRSDCSVQKINHYENVE